MSDSPDLLTPEQVNRIVEDRLARDRKTRVSVVSEPRTYGVRSPYSYFADIAAVAVDPTFHSGAHGRLDRYAREVAHEVEAGSPEGRYAENVVRETTRVEDATEHRRRADGMLKELRALTTGGGTTASAAGGSFAALVSPYFLLDETSIFRGVERAFADSCHTLPMPEWGMEVYIPAFTATDAVAQQTEGSAVAETDPTTGLTGGPVVTITGAITATQQLFDRGGSGGGSADVLIQKDLNARLDEKIDLYAIQTALATAGTFAGAASLTATSFKEVYTDMGTAREGITDTAGVRLRPTHVFTTYDLFSGLSDIMGSDGRPMVMPTEKPGYPIVEGADMGHPVWSRYTGCIMPGGLLWFTDDNIPPNGSNNQIIVTAAYEANVLLESPVPTFTVFPQYNAGNLEVMLNLRSYACLIARHPTGTQVYSGAAYPTTLK